MVRVLIMSGYGINCEKESAHAFKLAGGRPEIVHINDLISGKKKMADFDILMFPGGFSYGDDTGAGNAFANKLKNNLWQDLLDFIKAEKLILGVCNGFQIMTNIGLFALPDGEYGERINAMESNEQNRYECRWVNIKKESDCVFTKGIDMCHLPIAHGEGRFFCRQEVLKQIEGSHQVVFRYCKEDGTDAEDYPENPNGSMNNIAGICDRSGRIMGMMPHPERAIFAESEPDYHLKKELAKRKGEEMPDILEPNMMIFKNAIEHMRSK